MPEAVIVATARTPIGRANKGSLVDCRPDDLSALIIRSVLDKVPAARPRRRSKTSSGAAVSPPARRASTSPGSRRSSPGCRRARRDRQPLLLVVAADDPHGRAHDQGRRGRRVHRRWCRDRQPVRATARPTAAARTRSSPTARARTKERTEGGQPPWTPPAGLPDVYIAMGQTAENVVEAEGVDARRDGRVGRALAAARGRRAGERLFDREITPVTTPDGTVVSEGRRAARRHDGREARDAQPVFRPNGTVTAGNACPLNDGAAAVVVMSETKAQQLGVTPLARIVASGVSALNPEIMGLGPIEASRQALKRANLTSDDIDLVRDQRGVRGAGHPERQAPRHPVREAQRARRRDRARPPVRHDRRPHHDDADQRPADRRRALRPRDHVRRRRPGHGDDHRASLTRIIERL